MTVLQSDLQGDNIRRFVNGNRNGLKDIFSNQDHPILNMTLDLLFNTEVVNKSFEPAKPFPVKKLKGMTLA